MKLVDAIAAFKIDDLKLNKAIKRAAFTSDGYPYEKKLKRKKYTKQLEALQIELLKLQTHLKDSGEKPRPSLGRARCRRQRRHNFAYHATYESTFCACCGAHQTNR